MRGVWVTSDKVNKTIKNQDTLLIENTKYRVLHKKKNVDASFAEHPKFKNRSVLNMELGQLVSNENQHAMIDTGFSMKGALSVLFQLGYKSFQKKIFSSGMWVASDRLK